MRFEEFERTARAIWDGIPIEYKEGVDGLTVEREARENEAHAEVFTLGECVTEDYPSAYGGPDTTRSAVVLYYGSFREVARDADEFEWEPEIHETIMHELQHHLESLATEDALEDVDYAVDENFKRLAGEPFDPLFYRAGERVRPRDARDAVSAYKVECDVFLEVVTRERAAFRYEFEWGGVRYAVPVPAAEADVTLVYLIDGPDVSPGEFCIVRVPQRGMLATLRAAFGSGDSVAEVEVTAEIRA